MTAENETASVLSSSDSVCSESCSNQSNLLASKQNDTKVTVNTDSNPKSDSEILQIALQNSFLVAGEVDNNYILEGNENSSVVDHTSQVFTTVPSFFNEENVEIIFEDVVDTINEEIVENKNKQYSAGIEKEVAKNTIGTENAEDANEGFAEDIRAENENNTEEDREADDPDYEVAESDLNDSENDLEKIDGNERKNDLEKIDENGRKRRRKSKKEEWSRQKTKLRRMTGSDYVGYTRNREGEVSHNKERDARVLGPHCTSSKCLKYTNRFCSTITEEQRKLIFSKFWEEMSWDQKKVYVSGLMEVKQTGRRYVENSRRSTTYNYFLKVRNEKKQVCKKMFLATLGLKEWMVTNWCTNTVNGIVPSADVLNARRKSIRPKSERDIKAQEQVQYLNKFFEDLPKMPSHYCRKDSKKLYLEYNFESKANLYRIYKEMCLTNEKEALSSCYFSETFEKLNLAIFSPKKDQCNTCVAFKVGNVTEDEYNRHVSLKDLARESKNADKTKCNEGTCHAFVMDVQAVKMCPVNNANKFYFKTRLNVHNFTIYDMNSHDCCNYWWNEVEGDLCSSVFTTIIIDHLHTYCQDDLPIILWSDGCPYQNRNVVLSNALLQYAVLQKKIIIQKYLEPGHTQMECDAVHSLIERKITNKEITLPYDYVRKTREARQKPFPLKAKYMTHDQFRNYDGKDLMRYKSIRPERMVNDPTVINLREIHYSPNGTIGYKIHFSDEVQQLPQRIKEVDPYKEPSKLFATRLKIKKQKFDHLQDIKSTLEKEFFSFYDELQYE